MRCCTHNRRFCVIWRIIIRYHLQTIKRNTSLVTAHTRKWLYLYSVASESEIIVPVYKTWPAYTKHEQERQCTYVQRNVEALSWIIVLVRPGAWACACTCVNVALLMQHETRVRHIVTSFVAPQDPPHFSTSSHKWRDFRKNVTEYPYFSTSSHKWRNFRKNFTEHNTCVLILSTAIIQSISFLQEEFGEILSKMWKSPHVE